MKNISVKLIKLFIVFGLTTSTYMLIAQPPPPPGGSSGAGAGAGGINAERNGAPIGGGLFILLGLGAAYGAKKIFNNSKNNNTKLDA